MNCNDVRECLGALRSERLALTEMALLEAHIRECAECCEVVRPRQAPPGREALPSLAVLPQPPSPRPSLLGQTARVGIGLRDTARAGMGRAALLVAHLRALLPIPVMLTARAGSRAGETATMWTPPGRPATASLAPAVAAHANAPRRGLIDRHRTRTPWLRLRSRLSIAFSPAARGVCIGLLAALALYAFHYHPDLEPEVGREAIATVAATQPTLEARTSAAPDGRMPLESQQPESTRAPRPALTRAARAMPQPPRRPAATSGEPARPRTPSTAHVAGRLSVKDRSSIERDLTVLLARTGGTLLGTDTDKVVTFVDAVVPQSSYQQFTLGLTRIGSWRVEAERSPLPEDVHLTIRVGR